MSREDIQISTSAGDVVMTSISANIARQAVTLQERDTDVLCTVEIPASFDVRKLAQGVYVKIPYTPIEKPLSFRFARISVGGIKYIMNPVDGSQVFRGVATRYGRINACRLFEVDENFMYTLTLNNDTVTIYSANESDFQQISGHIQNRNLLLRCLPGNSYRYPLSGVGLILYTNGVIERSDLASVLEREFSEDGVTVNNAVFDNDTKQLQLDLDYGDV